MQNADKRKNAKKNYANKYTEYKNAFCRQICVQNTNIQIAKMHNADKSQNTNTHDLNAKNTIGDGGSTAL